MIEKIRKSIQFEIKKCKISWIEGELNPGLSYYHYTTEPFYKNQWKLKKYFNIWLNFTTKGSKIQFLTYFRLVPAGKTYSKSIFLKKCNFYHKINFLCRYVLNFENGLFGCIFACLGIMFLNPANLYFICIFYC